MPYEPTTNFKDSDGVDLGKKLVTKDYLLEVYRSLLDSLSPGLTPTPAIWIWGRNSYAQLGTNDIISRRTPVTTFAGGNDWKSIACGRLHTAAIKTDGTLWTWGYNNIGQLGTRDGNTRTTPVTTFLGGNDWKSVDGGDAFTIALKTDGSLWVWGYNFYGQLGINNTSNRNTPVTTFLGGNNWKSIACGELYTVAIKTDGTLWTWGYNFYGQLGINNTTNRTTPVTTFLGGNNWKSIAGGDDHTVAIKTDGSLWTWGYNSFGQLGTNDTTNRNTPVTTFLGGNDWKSVAAGGLHTVAIKTDGSLWSWGSNIGQLGTNDTTNRSTPVTTFLGGNNWKSVAAGGGNTVAIKTDGSLWTCGNNSFGQLGTNNTIPRSTPVTTFLGGNNWKSVSARFEHTLAIQSVDYI